MGSLRKQAGFVVAAIAFVGSVVGILAWWLPSSATWLNKHGFAAWPLAGLLLLLLAWTIFNWYHSSQELAAFKSESNRELAALRVEIRKPVPEDVRLYEIFKQSLPRDSPVLSWLRHAAGERLYRHSDIGALIHHIDRWRATDEHFIDSQLDNAYQNFNEAAQEFLSYQGQYVHWAPQEMQVDEDNILLIAYEYDGKNTAQKIQKGLGTRADTVLAAYKEFYETGSRLGL